MRIVTLTFDRPEVLNAYDRSMRDAIFTAVQHQRRAVDRRQQRALRNLPAGAIVYPTGEREGMWWRVADENDNEGWVNNDFLQPAQ